LYDDGRRWNETNKIPRKTWQDAGRENICFVSPVIQWKMATRRQYVHISAQNINNK